MWTEFRKAIDAHFEKLQSETMESSLNNFKSYLETEGKKGNFARERRIIKEQIDKLKNDILLWENNLGFLAHSKQADLLKAEFDKKMDKAKADIALLNAKLKMLNKEESEKKDEKQD